MESRTIPNLLLPVARLLAETAVVAPVTRTVFLEILARYASLSEEGVAGGARKVVWQEPQIFSLAMHPQLGLTHLLSKFQKERKLEGRYGIC